MKRTYYIVLETNQMLGWKIRTTENNLDTPNGLKNEINRLEREYLQKGQPEGVVILSWKRLSIWKEKLCQRKELNAS